MNISRISVFTFNINDYSDEATLSPETGYSLNLWIQWPFPPFFYKTYGKDLDWERQNEELLEAGLFPG